MKFQLSFLFFLCSSLLFFGCSSNSQQEPAQEETPIHEVPYSASADRLPPADLVLALPEAVLNLNKASGSSGTSKMKDGTEVTMVRRVYKEGDKVISFEITDSGTLGKTMDTFLPWMNQSADVRNDKLIERNFVMDGFPAYEKYSFAEQAGEVHVLPNKRFEIILRGRNVSLDELKKAIREWDIEHSVSTMK